MVRILGRQNNKFRFYIWSVGLGLPRSAGPQGYYCKVNRLVLVGKGILILFMLGMENRLTLGLGIYILL